ncbi:MAG: ATP-binding cassette domain-containing protein, partial [Ilumatobacteraceae bacterium]
PRDRDIAMVFQSYALYPHLSVFDNIAFGLKLRKMPKPEIREKVEYAARILDLTEHLDRRPKVLSGGQRQRVAMGRAIVREPQAFLMDEPLSNLDAKLRGQMRAEISAIQANLGVTTMYVTHDQIEAMTMGDRVAVIDRGLLQQVATPRELYLDPDNVFVAGFMGSPPMNMAEVMVESDGDALVVLLDNGRIAVGPAILDRRPALRNYVGKRVVMGVRPEDVKECAEHTEIPADRRLSVRVDLVEALGSGIEVHFAFPAPRPEQWTGRENSEEASVVGELIGEQPGANGWVGTFGPRSFVRNAQTVDIGLDTDQAYFFDLDSGLAIRD